MYLNRSFIFQPQVKPKSLLDFHSIIPVMCHFPGLGRKYPCVNSDDISIIQLALISTSHSSRKSWLDVIQVQQCRKINPSPIRKNVSIFTAGSVMQINDILQVLYIPFNVYHEVIFTFAVFVYLHNCLGNSGLRIVQIYLHIYTVQC